MGVPVLAFELFRYRLFAFGADGRDGEVVHAACVPVFDTSVNLYVKLAHSTPALMELFFSAVKAMHFMVLCIGQDASRIGVHFLMNGGDRATRSQSMSWRAPAQSYAFLSGSSA